MTRTAGAGACGFYPGSEPGECTNGAAASFDEARAGFLPRPGICPAKRTPSDFAAWRYQIAATAWKYAMWSKRWLQVADPKCESGMTTCFCGAIINNKASGDHIRACPHGDTSDNLYICAAALC